MAANGEISVRDGHKTVISRGHLHQSPLSSQQGVPYKTFPEGDQLNTMQSKATMPSHSHRKG